MNKTRVSTTKVKVTVGVQTLSFLCYINIEGGEYVGSETSVCMKGFNFFFTYELIIDVWCVANKTQISTTKVKVTVEV
jgi:hypothetical protein